MRRRRIVGIVGAALAVVMMMPFAAEFFISRSLDLAGIRTTLVETLSEKAGMPASIEGISFDIFRGVILSDVKLCPEGRPCLLQVDRVVLAVSYWKAINKEFPITRVRAESGRLSAAGLEDATRARISGLLIPEDKIKAKEPVKDPKGGTQSAQKDKSIIPYAALVWEAEDLRLIFSDASAEGAAAPVVSMTAWNEAGVSHVKSLLRSGSGARLRAHGQLVSGRWRWDYRTHKFPVSVLRSLSRDAFPQAAKFRWPEECDLTVKGSVDMGVEYFSVHFKGYYDNLALQYPARGRSLLRIEGGEGKVEFIAGYALPVMDNVFTKATVEQDDLQAAVTWEKRFSAKNDILTINAAMPLDEDDSVSLFSGLMGDGDLELKGSVQVPHGSGEHEPNFTLKVKRATFRMPRRFGKAADLPAMLQKPLYIEDGEATWARTCAIKMHGKALGAPFTLSGQGEMPLSRNGSGADAAFSLGKTMTLKTEVKALHFREVVRAVTAIWDRAQKLGYSRGAEKAEDLGPTWRYSFMDTDVYRSYVRPTEIDWQIKMTDIEDRGPWPANLDFSIKKHDGFLRFDLPEQKQETATVRFKYDFDMEPKLPRHELIINLEADNAGLVLPEILGSQTALGKVKLQYEFNGDGWLEGDLANRSYSRLELDASGLDLTKIGPAGIVAQAAGIKVGPSFLCKEFRLVRTTDGPLVRYPHVAGSSEDFSFLAIGDYMPLQGGSLAVGFSVNRPDMKKNGRVDLKILADGRWVPDSQ